MPQTKPARAISSSPVDQRRMRVPEQQRPVGHHVVDVAAAGRRRRRMRRARDACTNVGPPTAPSRTNRRIAPAGEHGARPRGAIAGRGRSIRARSVCRAADVERHRQCTVGKRAHVSGPRVVPLRTVGRFYREARLAEFARKLHRVHRTAVAFARRPSTTAHANVRPADDRVRNERLVGRPLAPGTRASVAIAPPCSHDLTLELLVFRRIGRTRSRIRRRPQSACRRRALRGGRRYRCPAAKPGNRRDRRYGLREAEGEKRSALRRRRAAADDRDAAVRECSRACARPARRRYSTLGRPMATVEEPCMPHIEIEIPPHTNIRGAGRPPADRRTRSWKRSGWAAAGAASAARRRSSKAPPPTACASSRSSPRYSRRAFPASCR